MTNDSLLDGALDSNNQDTDACVPPHSPAGEIESYTRKIAEKAHKNIEVEGHRPIEDPNPEPGFCSYGDPEKREYAEIPEGRIPILPLRYAPKDELIFQTRNEDKPFKAKDKHKGNYENYILTRLRRGFVFIYYPVSKSSCKWEIYRYETVEGDENGREERTDTNETPLAPNYSFTKYDVKSLDQEIWDFDRGEPSTSVLHVPQDTDFFYIAYSEFRWPSSLFKEVENNVDLRYSLMRGINPNRLGIDSCYIKDLLKFDTTFLGLEDWMAYRAERKYEASFELSQVGFEGLGGGREVGVNEIRYTNLNYELLSLSLLVKEEVKSEGWGLAIFLEDSIGEQLDFNYYSVFMQHFIEEYISIRNYPLITGKFIENLREEKYKVYERGKQRERNKTDAGFGVQVSDWVEAKSLDVEDELDPKYDECFGKLVNAIVKNEDIVGTVLGNAYNYFISSNAYFNLSSEFDSLGQKLSGNDALELAAYRGLLFSRSLSLISGRARGAQFLDMLFNNAKPKKINGELYKYYELIDKDMGRSEYFKIFKILEGVLGGAQVFLEKSPDALKAIFKFIETFSNAVFQGYREKKEEYSRLFRYLFKKDVTEVYGTDDIKKVIIDIHSDGTVMTRDRLEIYLNERLGGGGGNYKFDGPRKLTTVKPIVDLNKSAFVNRIIDYAPVVSNGPSIIAAFVTFFDNMDSFGKDSGGHNEFVNFTSHPAAQIFGAVLDVFAGFAGIGRGTAAKAMKAGTIAEAMSAASRLKKLLIKGASLEKTLVFSAGVVTAILSAGAFVNSYEKRDTYGMLGNGMWALSPVFLIAASKVATSRAGFMIVAGVTVLPSWLNVIGWALLVVGMVMLFFQRNEIKEWVYNGFWGRSSSFFARELRYDEAEDIAKVVDAFIKYDNRSQKMYNRFNLYAEKDLASLYQLCSYIIIDGDLKLDSKVLVRSDLIVDENSISKFSVKIDFSNTSHGKIMDYIHNFKNAGYYEFISKGLAYVFIDKERIVNFVNGNKAYTTPTVRVGCVYDDGSFSKEEWGAVFLEDL